MRLRQIAILYSRGVGLPDAVCSRTAPYGVLCRSRLHLNPQPSILNPQPSTLNPQPTTLNPQCYSLKTKSGGGGGARAPARCNTSLAPKPRTRFHHPAQWGWHPSGCEPLPEAQRVVAGEGGACSLPEVGGALDLLGPRGIHRNIFIHQTRLMDQKRTAAERRGNNLQGVYVNF